MRSPKKKLWTTKFPSTTPTLRKWMWLLCASTKCFTQLCRGRKTYSINSLTATARSSKTEQISKICTKRSTSVIMCQKYLPKTGLEPSSRKKSSTSSRWPNTREYAAIQRRKLSSTTWLKNFAPRPDWERSKQKPNTLRIQPLKNLRALLPNTSPKYRGKLMQEDKQRRVAQSSHSPVITPATWLTKVQAIPIASSEGTRC